MNQLLLFNLLFADLLVMLSGRKTENEFATEIDAIETTLSIVLFLNSCKDSL